MNSDVQKRLRSMYMLYFLRSRIVEKNTLNWIRISPALSVSVTLTIPLPGARGYYRHIVADFHHCCTLQYLHCALSKRVDKGPVQIMPAIARFVVARVVGSLQYSYYSIWWSTNQIPQDSSAISGTMVCSWACYFWQCLNFRRQFAHFRVETRFFRSLPSC